MLIKFCNSYFKKWLKDNDIKTYSAYNEGKSVVTERFIRTPKSKIYRHITVVSKNVYSDMLVTYNTTKMKPIDIKSSSYGEYNVDSNDKDTKFKVCNYVRISNTTTFLLKDMRVIGQKKFLWSAKLKILYHGLMLSMI